jgi:hypothetical protein
VLPQGGDKMYEYIYSKNVHGYPIAVRTFLTRDLFITATGHTPEEMGAKKLA